MTAAVNPSLAAQAADALLARNAGAAAFFAAAAPAIAATSRAMAERFARGGRLYAFGRGATVSDAQHVAVEFVHPVIVGKRALPAVDISCFDATAVATLLGPDDMVIGVDLPGGNAEVRSALESARTRGNLVIDPLGGTATAGLVAAAAAFVAQEWAEVYYHTLWETVHVFLERRPRGHDVGSAAFLYPFLGTAEQDDTGLLDEVAASILIKVQDDADLRRQVAESEADAIAAAVAILAERVAGGGTIHVFGNGGSATDANDLAFDCVSPPEGMRPIAALSLASDAATITAVANDVGNDLIFVRQLIAHARAGDVVVGISTSGGSRNVVAALEQARKQGLPTIALLGYDGGEIRRRGLADAAIVIHSDYIPRIQEVQASVYHIMRDLLEESHAKD
ncbi:MAG TPA: SIS domain-containing protein [Gemmatimonadales bacterium]|jgi:D-sedoheptulose 7-phosphate isomerase